MPARAARDPGAVRGASRHVRDAYYASLTHLFRGRQVKSRDEGQVVHATRTRVCVSSPAGGVAIRWPGTGLTEFARSCRFYGVSQRSAPLDGRQPRVRVFLP